MSGRRKPPTASPAPLPGVPSPRVMKLQMLGAVVGPMLLVGFLLHRVGFW